MPRMQNHGGHCCGVTHLYLRETCSPDSKTPTSKEFDYKDAQATGVPTSIISNDRTYITDTYRRTVGFAQFSGHIPPAVTVKRPVETSGERAEALIEAMKKVRRSGLIEVVTTNEQDGWYSWLEAHGFVAVTKAVNSNSGNLLTIWHLRYGDDPDNWEPDEDDWDEDDDF